MPPKIDIKNAIKNPAIADAIELTLILKAIGFRLESLNFDQAAKANGTIGENGGISMAKSLSPPLTKDDDHLINVQITCSKSNIVSNLTYKLRDDSECSCPDVTTNENNSFWEIQSTGPFNNRRSSAIFKHGDRFENDTSSNLLPVLSDKSTKLTQAFIQVLLKQYKQDVLEGQVPITPSANDDIKRIINTVSRDATDDDTLTNEAKTPIQLNVNAGVSAPPYSSCATSESLSPGSDVSVFSQSAGFYSNTSNQIVERDANVIQNLNQIRYLVDVSLLQMKLNSKETDSSLFTDLLTVTPNFAKKTSGQFFESSHRSGSGPSVPLVKRAISLNSAVKLSASKPSKTLSKARPDFSNIKSKITSTVTPTINGLRRTTSMSEGLAKTSASKENLKRASSTRAAACAISASSTKAKLLLLKPRASVDYGQKPNAGPATTKKDPASRKSLPSISAAKAKNNLTPNTDRIL